MRGTLVTSPRSRRVVVAYFDSFTSNTLPSLLTEIALTVMSVVRKKESPLPVSRTPYYGVGSNTLGILYDISIKLGA